MCVNTGPWPKTELDKRISGSITMADDGFEVELERIHSVGAASINAVVKLSPLARCAEQCIRRHRDSLRPTCMSRTIRIADTVLLTSLPATELLTAMQYFIILTLFSELHNLFSLIWLFETMDCTHTGSEAKIVSVAATASCLMCFSLVVPVTFQLNCFHAWSYYQFH